MSKISSLYGTSVIVLLALISTGCSTGSFGKFYESYSTTAYPPTKEVKVYAYSKADEVERVRRGYTLIGESAFEGPLENESRLLRQARRIGADIVLLKQEFVETRQVVVPYMVRHRGQTATAYTDGQVRGQYGSANYSGTTTIQMPDYTTTEYIPRTITRYKQNALFFRKNQE